MMLLNTKKDRTCGEGGTRKTRGVEKRRTRTVQKGSRRKERRKKRKIKNYEIVLSYGQLLFCSLCVDIDDNEMGHS